MVKVTLALVTLITLLSVCSGAATPAPTPFRETPAPTPFSPTPDDVVSTKQPIAPMCQGGSTGECAKQAFRLCQGRSSVCYKMYVAMCSVPATSDATDEICRTRSETICGSSLNNDDSNPNDRELCVRRLNELCLARQNCNSSSATTRSSTTKPVVDCKCLAPPGCRYVKKTPGFLRRWFSPKSDKCECGKLVCDTKTDRSTKTTSTVTDVTTKSQTDDECKCVAPQGCKYVKKSRGLLRWFRSRPKCDCGKLVCETTTDKTTKSMTTDKTTTDETTRRTKRTRSSTANTDKTTKSMTTDKTTTDETTKRTKRTRSSTTNTDKTTKSMTTDKTTTDETTRRTKRTRSSTTTTDKTTESTTTDKTTKRTRTTPTRSTPATTEPTTTGDECKCVAPEGCKYVKKSGGLLRWFKSKSKCDCGKLVCETTTDKTTKSMTTDKTTKSMTTDKTTVATTVTTPALTTQPSDCTKYSCLPGAKGKDGPAGPDGDCEEVIYDVTKTRTCRNKCRSVASCEDDDHIAIGGKCLIDGKVTKEFDQALSQPVGAPDFYSCAVDVDGTVTVSAVITCFRTKELKEIKHTDHPSADHDWWNQFIDRDVIDQEFAEEIAKWENDE